MNDCSVHILFPPEIQPLNLALLPTRGRALLSRLIENFSPDSRFFLHASPTSDQVEDYLKIAHPQLRFEFVTSDNPIPAPAWITTPDFYCDPWPDLSTRSDFSLEIPQAASFSGVCRINQLTWPRCEAGTPWHDPIPIQSIAQYRDWVSKTSRFDFSKADEFIYFENNHVIKWNKDSHIAQKRTTRAKLNPEVFPQAIRVQGQFMAYRHAVGETFYRAGTPARFIELLRWLDTHLWLPKNIENSRVALACRAFYQEKTQSRLQEFAKTGIPDEVATVRGEPVAGARQLLKRVNWDRLSRGVARFIHGDLQFANIIFDAQTSQFTLLDWRPDFAGELEFGDLYYDLAKLYGGLIIHYEDVQDGQLWYEERDGKVDFGFRREFNRAPYIQVLAQFVEERELDFARVQEITALIFLNMAPLHAEPFNRMLYYLGRQLLQSALQR